MSAWLAFELNSQPHSDFLCADRGSQARGRGLWFGMTGDNPYAGAGFRLEAGALENPYRQSHTRRRCRTSG
jgi:hypothetical protein